jgi:hypothetical protein
MSSEPTPRSPWRLAAALALVHVIVAAPLLFELRVRVPVYMKEFKEYNMALPLATQYFADASQFAASGAGNLFMLIAFLVADGFLLWYLLQEHPTLAWGWFLAVLVLLLLLAGCAEWAMWLAQHKLHEALSRP